MKDTFLVLKPSCLRDESSVDTLTGAKGLRIKNTTLFESYLMLSNQILELREQIPLANVAGLLGVCLMQELGKIQQAAIRPINQVATLQFLELFYPTPSPKIYFSDDTTNPDYEFLATMINNNTGKIYIVPFLLNPGISIENFYEKKRVVRKILQKIFVAGHNPLLACNFVHAPENKTEYIDQLNYYNTL